jgi:hypothetical protein
VDRIIVNTMDYVVDPTMADLAILPKNEEEFGFWKEILDHIKTSSERLGVGFHYYLKHPVKRRKMCTENATRSVFVAVDGSVAPCVFACLPVTETTPPNILPPGYRRITFGNINDEPMSHIWKKCDYRRFRNSFVRTIMGPPCSSCAKLYMTENGN